MCVWFKDGERNIEMEEKQTEAVRKNRHTERKWDRAGGAG
jgi:hypothetical protein